ncbi:MAG: glycosyltransferase family 25 protein [Alphaproteobacteria bacterium]|nr:glycosyltransferase family 25 protein [Alphaproteobacteria bacterium]
MFNFLFNKSRSDFKIHAGFAPNSVGAFLINLDRATERLEFVKPNIDQLGFPVERISAVDGKLLSEEELRKVCDYKKFKGYFKMLPERGTIGCSLSHEKALERFLESEYEFALIFEDDVIFNPHELRECVNRAIEKKDLWDILNFETFHDGFPFKIADLYENKNMSLYFTPVTHAGCYLINRCTAKKLLEKFYPIIMPFDHYFAASWEFDIKFVGVEPRIVKQNFGNSQIKSESTKKFNCRRVKLSNTVFNIRRVIVGFMYNLYLFIKNLMNQK